MYHSFSIIVFYQFSHTQTLNPKQQQYHIIVKEINQKPGSICSTSWFPLFLLLLYLFLLLYYIIFWFIYIFILYLFLLSYLFLHIYNKWCKYFKYFTMKQKHLKNEWFMSWYSTFCYNFPSSTQTAHVGWCCQGGTSGKKLLTHRLQKSFQNELWQKLQVISNCPYQKP